MDMTLGDMVGWWAEGEPDSRAIISIDGSTTTYRELGELIRSRAGDLAGAGVSAGDRVAIVLPNGPHAASAFLTVADLATAAPLNPGLTQPEFEFYLGDLDAKALIVMAGDDSPSVDAAGQLGIPILRLTPDPSGAASFTFEGLQSDLGGERPAPQPDDIALVLHTSGTTARPKIVPLSHTNLRASAQNVAGTLQLSQGDTCLNVMPLFHIHGLVAALLATLSAGATVACSPGFQAPSFFGWLEAADASWYTAVPTMHQAILERVRAGEWTAGTGRLRLARSSSASLAPTIIEGIEQVVGVPVVEAYGMTEAAHQMASNPLPPAARKPGSVGPAAGPEVAIADKEGTHLGVREIGEVVIRGPNVTAGYHRLPDQSDHFHTDGWFRTGDQGYLDEDGYLFLTGRLKEIINRGGETIAPREIDEVLLAVEGVRQAVAFAVPDPALGEEVGAAVVLEEDSDLTESRLQNLAAESLSVAKVPKRIVFLDEVPKGATGKLQRIGLANRLGIDSVRAEATDADAVGSDTIERVRRIWESVLELPAIGPDDPFLESGGDSLGATALAVAIETEFDLDLPLLAFYKAATIRQQAALLEELTAG